MCALEKEAAGQVQLSSAAKPIRPGTILVLQPPGSYTCMDRVDAAILVDCCVCRDKQHTPQSHCSCWFVQAHRW